jgi:hypothetical protein
MRYLEPLDGPLKMINIDLSREPLIISSRIAFSSSEAAER